MFYLLSSGGEPIRQTQPLHRAGAEPRGGGTRRGGSQTVLDRALAPAAREDTLGAEAAEWGMFRARFSCLASASKRS